MPKQHATGLEHRLRALRPVGTLPDVPSADNVLVPSSTSQAAFEDVATEYACKGNDKIAIPHKRRAVAAAVVDMFTLRDDMLPIDSVKLKC